MSFMRPMLPDMDTVTSLVYRPGRDAGRLCKPCKWVDAISIGSMGFRCPQRFCGEALELLSCCSCAHELGPDDELHIE
jgi:hypothetical protein